MSILNPVVAAPRPVSALIADGDDVKNVKPVLSEDRNELDELPQGVLALFSQFQTLHEPALPRVLASSTAAAGVVAGEVRGAETQAAAKKPLAPSLASGNALSAFASGRLVADPSPLQPASAVIKRSGALPTKPLAASSGTTPTAGTPAGLSVMLPKVHSAASGVALTANAAAGVSALFAKGPAASPTVAPTAAAAADLIAAPAKGPDAGSRVAPVKAAAADLIAAPAKGPDAGSRVAPVKAVAVDAVTAPMAGPASTQPLASAVTSAPTARNAPPSANPDPVALPATVTANVDVRDKQEDLELLPPLPLVNRSEAKQPAKDAVAPPKSMPEPPLKTEPGADKAAPSYLQVPFSKGETTGLITVSKAGAERPDQLVLSPSSVSVFNHLSEGLAQAPDPRWRLNDQQARDQGGGQNHGHMDEDTDDSARQKFQGKHRQGEREG